MFTTRPEIQGTFGTVASTHWIASQVGMALLERGGNAFDAACGAGFTLQVTEPHLNGPGGDLPILLWRADRAEARVICGQGPSPRLATLERFRQLDLDLVPGTGLLPAVVPGSFDAWMRLLRDHGRLPLRAVLEPAIGYAERGVPVLPRLSATLRAVEALFRRWWPDSAALYLAGGMPQPGSLLGNPVLAGTWRRLLAEAEAAGSDRIAQIEAARGAWRSGFVAEAIDRYCRTAEAMDISGRRNPALLRGEDLSAWEAGEERPLSGRYAGVEVLKCGPWSQGPALLQALAILEGTDIADLPPESDRFVHMTAETLKLVMADRETFYADPDCVAVPTDHLLSAGYAAERRALLGEAASAEFRPGTIPGFGHPPDFAAACARRKGEGPLAAYGAGEPTFDRPADAALAMPPVGDTSFVCAADAEGNLVAATPSGGWLQASPVIPELGFCLGTRAQSFWLDPRAPNVVAPGKRPRTTLTPTLVLRDGRGWLACGTPGGEQQEQWQLQFLLRLLHHDRDMQAAIDRPTFRVEQWPSSFYPRNAVPQRLAMEARFPAETLAALAARGHTVAPAPGWSEGRLCAVANDGAGTLRAAASPRGMQAYAVGR